MPVGSWLRRRTPSRASGSGTGSSSLCVSQPRTVVPHGAAYRAQGKATSGAMMRALTGCAVERGIIEVPLRRSELPDELRKIVAVFVITCAAAFCRKIKLVPPFELSVWWQRCLAGFLTADQIAAYRNDPLAAFRPKHRHDVSGARAPIE